MDRRSFLSGLALLLTGCMPRDPGLSIGSKNFTEQLVLGELLAQSFARATPLPIERRFYLAGTYICHQALLAGRIDMYVEYTGTALVAILKEQPASDHAAVFNTVKDLYARKFGLEVLPSLGFDNTFAMVMRGADARRLRLKTLSDAAAISGQLRLGVGYEFIERPDGYKGLAAKYGFRFAEAPRVMDLGLLYRALQNNQVDIVAGSNTDGLIAALDLVVLDDDRHYFPPYDAVPIVRRETLERHPEVGKTLRVLSGRISADDMRRMNYAVDGEKKDAATVVKDFLDRRFDGQA
jgi:osmoprotectant transport system substrate-binding protein